MEISGSVVLVTGANRGLGAAFVRGLLAEGAAKIYGAARSDYEPPEGVEPVRLDLTDKAGVAALAERLTDVTIVINNAGVANFASPMDDNAEDAIRSNMDTNFYGLLWMCRAFAPVLAVNGGGALVNVLSVSSWVTAWPHLSAYSMSKAAAWSLTNAMRMVLSPNGTLVSAVHPGLIDTDMASWTDRPKTSAEDAVKTILAGIRNGDEEILIDEVGRMVKALLSQPPAALPVVE